MNANDGGSRVKQIGIFLFLVIFSFSILESCKRRVKEGSKKDFTSTDYIDVDAFGDQLQPLLKPADSAVTVKIGAVSDNLNRVYQLTDYTPLWINGKGLSPAAEDFIAEAEAVQWDGISPEYYQVSGLKNELNKLKSDKSPELDRLIAFDTIMTHTYLAMARDLLVGVITPKKADSLWYNSNDSTWDAPQVLYQELAMNDKYPSLDRWRSKLPTYKLLQEEYKRFVQLDTSTVLKSAIAQLGTIKNTRSLDSAQKASLTIAIKATLPWVNTSAGDSLDETGQLVKAYQDYAHVNPTGKLDTSTLKKLSRQPGDIALILKANLERLRWLKQDMDSMYIMVNVPLAELFFRGDDGNEIMHMRTVVGKPERQTPALNAVMSNVVINPPWGVPPTILKKDVLPGINRSGEAYLAKKGLKVYDRKGNRVDASQVNSSNYKRYTYKQAPGNDNALGHVKFNLPNKWDIYLHDTPHREDFPRRYRAKSSGCVRIERPRELALYILAELEKKRFTEGRLDSIIRTHKTNWQVLKNKIPVHIVYLTAFEDREHAHIRLADDVYKRDAKLIEKLKDI